MSFSTPAGGVPIASSARSASVLLPSPSSRPRARIWTETSDPLDVDLSELEREREPRVVFDVDDVIDVIDVDRDGVEVLALDDEAPRFRLPTPRPPPRHSMPSSASIAVRRTLPPTAFEPPVTVQAASAERSPRVPNATSVAPVCMDTVTLVAAGRPRSLTGRPSLRWASALMVVGAAAGFLASKFAQPAAAPEEATIAVAHAPPAPEPVLQQTATTTLTFATPLDIRIPAPVAAPAPVSASPAAAAASPAAAPKPTNKIEKPAKAEKTESSRVTLVAAPPAPPARRNLVNASPEVVDALVREQLSSALR